MSSTGDESGLTPNPNALINSLANPFMCEPTASFGAVDSSERFGSDLLALLKPSALDIPLPIFQPTPAVWAPRARSTYGLSSPSTERCQRQRNRSPPSRGATTAPRVFSACGWAGACSTCVERRSQRVGVDVHGSFRLRGAGAAETNQLEETWPYLSISSGRALVWPKNVWLSSIKFTRIRSTR